MSSVTKTKEPAKPPERVSRLAHFDWRDYVVYIGIALVFVVFAIVLRNQGFLTMDNLVNIVQQTAPITVMAVGLVFVLAAGEIDLSIGSVVALSALVAAVLLRDGAHLVVAALAALATGAAIGLVNGLFVTRLRLPSFLVTLATLGIVAGLARVMTDLRSVPIVDEYFNGLFGSGRVAGISSLVLWTVLVVAVGHYLLRSTRFGAHVLAVGDNAVAARVSGIKVDRIRMAVLMGSATTAALAGLLYAGRLHGARYNFGENDLLSVIAAVIVGGTSLFGGRGTVVGALAGSLLMGMLNNGLILAGLSVSQQMIARGVIILLAVSVSLRGSRT